MRLFSIEIIGQSYLCGEYKNLFTELNSKGVGVRVLAEMAGHASIQTTQRYIDVNDEQMRRAAELI